MQKLLAAPRSLGPRLSSFDLGRLGDLGFGYLLVLGKFQIPGWCHIRKTVDLIRKVLEQVFPTKVARKRLLRCQYYGKASLLLLD
jgi:hypothetical protein